MFVTSLLCHCSHYVTSYTTASIIDGCQSDTVPSTDIITKIVELPVIAPPFSPSGHSPVVSFCHITSELVTTEPLGKLHERKMEVEETTGLIMILGCPGTIYIEHYIMCTDIIYNFLYNNII